MIRVVMLGRLANNLFQYAVGRMLSERHGVPLRMDASWFNAAGWLQVANLRRLPLRAEIVRSCSIGSRALRRLTGKHHWEFLGVPVIRESGTDHGFDVRHTEAPRSCVLMGYFQSPRYFHGIETLLRQELKMDHLPWSNHTRDLVGRLQASVSVAVHVRRTDYLRDPLWKVCDLNYYSRAMNRLREELSNPRFFVFSDDPEWCRSNLTDDDVNVCSLLESVVDPLHDLYLMSCAKHHIIANSSYSWWAAWLGRNAGQRVLCPPRWFQGDQIIAPITDKLCDGWVVA